MQKTMDNVFKRDTSQRQAALPVHQAIVTLAGRIGVGQHGAELCPECEGGAKHERSLSVLVEAGGQIKYHCHRAGCGLSGTVYSRPDLIPAVGEGTTAKTGPKPLTADLHMLSEREVEWFKNRFNLSHDAVTSIRRTAHRYALPIYAPDSSIRGWLTRRPWEGSPADTEEARRDSAYQFKTLTYMENLDPVMSWYSWYYNPNDVEMERIIFLVEDPISAMRLVNYWDTEQVHGNNFAVSILGTGVNAGKIAELQRNSSRLVIMLDADATGQAFYMARKWGQAFDYTRVVVLSKDIKDCSDDDLAKLPL
jgi:hypothetical protein